MLSLDKITPKKIFYLLPAKTNKKMKKIFTISIVSLFICCANKTLNNTELPEPIETAKGVMPKIPKLSDQSEAPEVETNKTIMRFVGEGDIDTLFFSKVLSVENYKNGKKHGLFIYYKEDGSIDRIEKYRNEELVK